MNVKFRLHEKNKDNLEHINMQVKKKKNSNVKKNKFNLIKNKF